jgi:hypothetical protein
VALNLSERQSSADVCADIFVVAATSGSDGGVKNLLTLMSRHGLSFYSAKSSPGLIGKDDLVIIKVNCQWDERGGTNTDLLKALVQEIVDHPEGFTGEIVIADNGQGQFGSTGHGGSLSYARNNAYDTGQSMQEVADSFAGHKVSTYLWDAITSRRAKEYQEGDQEDGYIVADAPSSQTGIVVTYPKFKTKYGTYVSFKLGVWDSVNKTYDKEKVKILNVPVLKSHGGYGVTGCIKHYMGVVSDRLSREAGGDAHWAVGSAAWERR